MLGEIPNPAPAQIEIAQQLRRELKSLESQEDEARMMRREMAEVMEFLEEKRNISGCVSFGSGLHQFVILPEPVEGVYTEEGRRITTKIYVGATVGGFKGIQFREKNPPSRLGAGLYFMRERRLRDNFIAARGWGGTIAADVWSGWEKPPAGVGYFTPSNSAVGEEAIVIGSGFPLGADRYTKADNSLIDITDVALPLKALEISIAANLGSQESLGAQRAAAKVVMEKLRTM